MKKQLIRISFSKTAYSK